MHKQGDIVILESKKPAVVISNDSFNDSGKIIVFPITSKKIPEKLGYQILNTFLEQGKIAKGAYILFEYPLCINKNEISRKVAGLKENIVKEVINKLWNLVKY